MSKKEIDRVELMGLLSQRRMTQADAAARLGISVRQVRRLLRAYEKEGGAGLVSKKRGKRSNRRTDAIRLECLALIRNHYGDFGPTLAH